MNSDEQRGNSDEQRGRCYFAGAGVMPNPAESLMRAREGYLGGIRAFWSARSLLVLSDASFAALVPLACR